MATRPLPMFLGTPCAFRGRGVRGRGGDARRNQCVCRAVPDDDGVVVIGSDSGSSETQRGVSIQDFIAAFETSTSDSHSDANPSGWVDLTQSESRLLEGKETARGWALGGIERKSPTNGAELKQECARVLVESGFGTPFVDEWLDSTWLTVLGSGGESNAVEGVVAVCLALEKEGDGTDKSFGVVILAPFRPIWPSQNSHLTSDAVIVSVDPESELFQGDVGAALSTAEHSLLENFGVDTVAVVVVGHPSPVTGKVLTSREISTLHNWCELRDAHCVVDETQAQAVDMIDRDVDGLLSSSEKKKKKQHWGRDAGFASTTSLWPKTESETNIKKHVVASFGASAGVARGKTTPFLLTRDSGVKNSCISDPYASALQVMLADGGVAVRESFGVHCELLNERRAFTINELKNLGIATGPSNSGGIDATALDGGLHVMVDLRPVLGVNNSREGEKKLWDQMANTFHVLLVPGGLCGTREPGWFRLQISGEEASLHLGLERIELAVRNANDTGCG